MDSSPKYLTENTLVEFCSLNIDNNYQSNKQFLNYKFRPDYVSHKEKVVVEFDGYLHYTKAKIVLQDIKKDEIIKSEGYRIIRIPYFVQLSSEVILHEFGLNINYSQIYQHGFIDDKAILPADFCQLGIERFKRDLSIKFNYIETEILHSLVNKVKSGLNPKEVFAQ